MARDEDFFERFVSGYEFPNVPKFRQDEESWDAFGLSICKSIAIEASKNRTKSLITRAVRTAGAAQGLDIADLEDTEILDWLRKSWSKSIRIDGAKTTVGAHIGSYWGTDEEEAGRRGLPNLTDVIGLRPPPQRRLTEQLAPG